MRRATQRTIGMRGARGDLAIGVTRPRRRRKGPRRAAAVGAALVASVSLMAAPAAACGGLVGANGTIELVKTTTLAAYHDGIERYVTSFEFNGAGEAVGSIVPLPGVPSDVVRGGDWTLQRLIREVRPPELESRLAFASAAGAISDEAEVLLETEIDALDITILRGGGDAVGRWALDNGFFLTPDAPEVLDFYAERSPVFMAARFDVSRAAALGQGAGDGTPIMVTIPTDDPWVPLRILGLGLDRTEVVEADVFLLTDDRPELLAGGQGLRLNRSEPASPLLLSDLRSDQGMEWVPADMWLTHLELEASALELDYDLAVATRPGDTPSLVAAGLAVGPGFPVGPSQDRDPWVLAAVVALGLAGIAAIGYRSTKPGPDR